MLKVEQKLNQKIFESDVERKAIRDGFGSGLVLVGEKNKNVVALTADLSESVRTEEFSKKFPERFFEVGIAEQNLVSVASGLAHMGKIPFAASYAMFSPGRSWEQVRTTIAYNNQPVKIIGSHAGLTTGPDGGTHQALEDIAITRVLPNMCVVVPCDSIEAEKATLAIAENKLPVYLRLGREKSPIVTTSETPFEIGKASVLFESPSQQLDLTIIATGILVHTALVVANDLVLNKNLEVAVINLHTIKPIDKKTLVDYAKKSKQFFTVEEHQIAGGMGSAVAEVLATESPIKINFIGVNDKFGQSGSPYELIEKYELHAVGIKKQILDNLI